MSDNIMMFSAAETVPEPIPTFDKDVQNISKMPDEPREENGWPPETFKAEFDKAAGDLKTYINETLIPALVAARLPFAPTSAIQAESVQAAIENVQTQIVETITGQIPNGSVTAEKLSQNLLNRTYGGVPWMSLDAPTEADNPGNLFPVGQEWISPRFEVRNLDSRSWSVTNGTAETSTNKVVFKGNKTLATLGANQTVAAGASGDKCYVLFNLGTSDPEIKQIRCVVDAQPTVIVQPGENLIELNLSGKSVAIRFEIEWPTASVADGSVEIDNLTIVNVGAIHKQLPGVIDKKDWPGYIRRIVPFDTKVSNFSGWVQVAAGEWSQEVFEVLPVHRGGTGITKYVPGQMLYADTNGMLQPLVPPRTESFLQYKKTPRWVNVQDANEALGSLRITSGTYEGDGENSRVIELPVKPKLLHIKPNGGPLIDTSNTDLWIIDNPVILTQGSISAANLGDQYGAKITLNGNQLRMDNIRNYNRDKSKYGNRQGITYTWTAIV